MEIQIRAYEPTDEQTCLVAFKSNVPSFFAEAEIELFAAFLKRLNKGLVNQTEFFVISDVNQVVGCGGFGDKDNAGIITLAWGLIHHDFHKKGLGKLLLKFRLEQIQLKYPNTPVFVDTTQFSVGFFEKLRFKTTKFTPDFYALGMHRYDMVLYPITTHE
jgi:ribosomal-protein-alanine N-acetyltransferase